MRFIFDLYVAVIKKILTLRHCNHRGPLQLQLRNGQR